MPRRTRPVVVGGTGGSGTRVVTRILTALGVDMGSVRNPAEDALPFAAFDWQWGPELLALSLEADLHGAAPHWRAAPREAFERILGAHAARTSGPWGWKHPHSYLLLPFLCELAPGLRFIHVIRDGRDVALSGNQLQLGHYGRLLLGPGNEPTDRRARSASFWSRANGLAADVAEAELDGAYLRLRLEDLCANPRASIEALSAFAGVSAGATERIVALVAKPAGLGRWRAAPHDVRATIEAAAGPGLVRFGYVSRPGPARPRASRPSAGAHARRPRVNLLLLMTDQHRWDALGCAGGWVRTPHLDRLASEGMRLVNAYTNAPACVPARVCLATGRYPHATGVWRNANHALSPQAPTWMRAVRDAGYSTSVFGKTHLHPHVGDLRDREPLMHAIGLDHVDEIAGPRASARCRSNLTDRWQEAGVYDAYQADLRDRYATKPWVARPSTIPLALYADVYVGQQAAAYLRRYDDPKPWCCWVSFGGPHEPWDAPEPYASFYDPGAMPAPIQPEDENHNRPRGLLDDKLASGGVPFAPGDVARLRANYAGNVTLIDDQIGEILRAVEDRGELERTVVAFISDHGEMNGDHNLLYKHNFLGPAARVPLIVRLPANSARASRGAVSEAIVELMDIGATLVDLAGGRPVPGSRACSLVPVLQGAAHAHRPLALSELSRESMVASAECKVVLNRQGEIYLLYDLRSDPAETHNLAGSPRCGEELLERARAMTAWLGTVRTDSRPRSAAPLVAAAEGP